MSDGYEAAREEAEEALPASVVVMRSRITGRPVAVPADVVAAAERPYAAYQLHLSGQSWESIAQSMGYIDARAVQADVTRYLHEGRVLVAEQTKVAMLDLEGERLNTLLAAVWGAAMKGHLPSVAAARAIVMDRVRLFGLDQFAIAAEDSSPNEGRTVIVPTDDTGYTRALREVAGG